MIAALTGRPEVLTDQVIIHTSSGVGYGVHAGGRLLLHLSTQVETTLYVHTFVKEDRLELYGFKTVAERHLFETVLDVSGVGPKTALTLIDAGSDRLVESVQQADLSFFTSIPRVGKKLGQKIIIELTSKLGSLKQLSLGPLSQQKQDVTDALINLGYSPELAHQTVTDLDLEELPLATAIKVAVKHASQQHTKS
jgi:holliday junction DNA helicase RuvA